jgi:hypothetical protein
LRAIRSDPLIAAEVRHKCDNLDASAIGMVPSFINNKKARGLMRAGGEAAQTLYTEWPHDFVLVGLENKRVFYKDLNFEQWGFGYVSILERQTDPVVRENMIRHLKNIYQDAINFGFKRAKSVHAKILNDIEEGVYTWRDTHAIAHARQVHIQRPLTLDELKDNIQEEETTKKHYDTVEYRNSSTNRHRYSPKHNKKTMYKTCRFYNEHRCNLEHEHKQGHIIWRHVCLECKKTGHRAGDCSQSKK